MKKALPIGVVNYREIQYENYYTVDETMMVQEFLERKSKVTLITRPRRFGKTSNMSRRCPPLVCLLNFLISRKAQNSYLRKRILVVRSIYLK